VPAPEIPAEGRPAAAWVVESVADALVSRGGMAVDAVAVDAEQNGDAVGLRVPCMNSIMQTRGADLPT
jgi:hypothetical protein